MTEKRQGTGNGVRTAAAIDPQKVVKMILTTFEDRFKEVADQKFTTVYSSFNTRKHWKHLLLSSTERNKNSIDDGIIDEAKATARAHAEFAWTLFQRPMSLEDVLDTLDEVKKERCVFMRGDVRIDGLICEF